MKLLSSATLGLNIAILYIVCLFPDSDGFKLGNFVRSVDGGDDSGTGGGDSTGSSQLTGKDGYFCKEFQLFCEGDSQSLNIQMAIDISDDVQTFFSDVANNSNTILSFASFIEQDTKLSNDENFKAAMKYFGQAMKLFDSVTFETAVQLETAMNKSDELFQRVIEELTKMKPKLNAQQLKSWETALANLRTLRTSFKNVTTFVKTYTITVTYTLTTEQTNAKSSMETNLDKLTTILKKLHETVKDKSQIEKLQSELEIIIKELTQTEFKSEEEFQTALKKVVTSLNSIAKEVNTLMKSSDMTDDEKANLKTIISIILQFSTAFKEFGVTGIDVESSGNTTETDGCKLLNLTCDSNGNIEIRVGFGFEIPKSVNDYFADLQPFLNLFLKFWSSLKRSGKISDQKSFDDGLKAFRVIVELFSNKTFKTQEEFETTLVEAKKQQQIIIEATKNLKSGLSSSDETLRADLEKQLGLLTSAIDNIHFQTTTDEYKIVITFKLSTEQEEAVNKIKIILRKLFFILTTLRGSVDGKTRDELDKIIGSVNKTVDLLTKNDFKTSEEFITVLKQVVIELNSIGDGVKSLLESGTLTENEKSDLHKTLEYVISFKHPFEDFGVTGITVTKSGNTEEVCKELEISCDNGTASTNVTFGFEENESVKSYFSQLTIFMNKYIRFFITLKQRGINNTNTDAIKAALKIIFKIFYGKKFENKDQLNQALTDAGKELQIIIENSEKLESSLTDEDKANLKTIITSTKEITETTETIKSGGEGSSFTIRITFDESPETNKTVTSIQTTIRNFLIRINLLIKSASGKDKEKLEAIKARIEQVIKSLNETEFKSEEELKTGLNKTVTEVNSAGTDVNDVIKTGDFDVKQKSDLEDLLKELGNLGKNFEDLGVHGIEIRHDQKNITIVLKFDASDDTETNVTDVNNIMSDITTTLETMEKDNQFENNEEFKTIVNTFKTISEEKKDFASQEALIEWLKTTGSKLSETYSVIERLIKSGSFSGEALTKLENLRRILILIRKPYKNLGIDLTFTQETSSSTESPETTASSGPGESSETTASSGQGESSETTASSGPGESSETTASSGPGESSETTASSGPGESSETTASSGPGESSETTPSNRPTDGKTADVCKELDISCANDSATITTNFGFNETESIKSYFTHFSIFLNKIVQLMANLKEHGTNNSNTDAIIVALKSIIKLYNEKTFENEDQLNKTMTEADKQFQVIIENAEKLRSVVSGDDETDLKEVITTVRQLTESTRTQEEDVRIRIIFDASPETKRTTTSIEDNLKNFLVYIKILISKASPKDKAQLEKIKLRIEQVISKLNKTEIKSEEELKTELNETVSEINSAGTEVNEVIKSGDFDETQKKYLEILLESLRNLGRNYENLNVSGVNVTTTRKTEEIVLSYAASNETKTDVKDIDNVRSDITTILEILEKDKQLENNEQFKTIFTIYKEICDDKKDFNSQEALTEWLKTIASKINNSYTEVDNLVNSGSFSGETQRNLEKLRTIIVLFTRPFKNFGINLTFNTGGRKMTITYDASEKTQSSISAINLFFEQIIKYLQDLQNEGGDNKEIEEIIKKFRLIITKLQTNYEFHGQLKTALEKSAPEINELTARIVKLTQDGKVNEKVVKILRFIISRTNDLSKQYEDLGVTDLIVRNEKSTGGIEIDINDASQQVKEAVESINVQLNKISSFEKSVNNSQNTEIKQIITTVRNLMVLLTKSKFTSEKDLKEYLQLSKSYFLKIYLLIKSARNSTNVNDNEKQNLETLENALKSLSKPYEAIGLRLNFDDEEEKITLGYDASPETDESVESINEDTQQIVFYLIKLLEIRELRDNKDVENIVVRYHTVIKTLQTEYDSDETLKAALVKAVPEINEITEDISKLLECDTIKGNGQRILKLILHRTNQLSEPFSDLGATGLVVRDNNENPSTGGIEVSFNTTKEEKHNINKVNNGARIIDLVLERIEKDNDLKNNADVKNISEQIRAVFKLLRIKFSTKDELQKGLTSTVSRINQVITEINTVLKSGKINSEGERRLKQFLTILIRIGRYYKALGVEGVNGKGEEPEGGIVILFNSTAEEKRNVYYINNDAKSITTIWQRIWANTKLRNLTDVVNIGKSIESFVKTISREFKTRSELTDGLKVSVTEINNVINGINKFVKSQDLSEKDERYFKHILVYLLRLEKWYKALGVTGIQSPGKTDRRIVLGFVPAREVKSSVEEVNSLLQQGRYLFKVLLKFGGGKDNTEIKKLDEKVDAFIDDLTEKEYKSQTDLNTKLTASVKSINEIISTIDKMLTSGKFSGILQIYLNLLLNVFAAINEPYLKIDIKGINTNTDYCPCSKKCNFLTICV